MHFWHKNNTKIQDQVNVIYDSVDLDYRKFNSLFLLTERVLKFIRSSQSNGRRTFRPRAIRPRTFRPQ